MDLPVRTAGFLVLDRISARERGRTVLDGLSLALARGERLALLGAPGAGTTACVQLLAGFRRVVQGEVWLDGRAITHAAPHTRNIAAVFQEDTVFPHLSVLDNVAFGLKLRRVGTAERRRQAAAALAAVGATGLAGRHPARLDAAERRVVALARAAVLSPALLLVDEPATPADAPQRAAVRAALAAVLASQPLTCILATHDPQAAFAMADRVALLHEGTLLQLGTPQDLYQRPATRRVAAFTGACNILAGHLERHGNAATVALADGAAPALAPSGLVEGPALICVRPHRVQPDPRGPVRGPIESIAYLGGLTRITLRLPQGPFVAELHEAPAGVACGDVFGFGWPAEAAWAMPMEPS
jgi:putative spermidine/putrescine transport system ATP-binding protein